MPTPHFGPDDVGRVVTVRVRTRVGPSDVVGTVLAVSAERLTLRRRDGRVDELPLTAIVAGRVVPPSAAERVGVDELQRVAALGWRALEVEPLGAWLLRAGGGFTGRANSALAVGDPGGPLEEAVATVRQWYAARGLPPRVQLPIGAAPAGLDAALEAAGWAASPPVHVMTAELAHVLRAAGDPDPAVTLDREPDDAWLAAYRQDAGPLPPVARAVLVNHPAAVFASVRGGDECLATARAAVDRRWAGLFAVEVRPAHRRRGLGRAVTAAALRWAVRQGARHGYLQTAADNTPAVTLYGRLGFAVHHDYVYRVGTVER